MPTRVQALFRAAMVLITGGSIATSSAIALQVPTSPYTAPLIGLGGSAMLALIGLTYRGVIKKIDDIATTTNANYATLEAGQDAIVHAIFNLERKLHPEESEIILEEMQQLSEFRAQFLADQAKKKSAAASKA